MMVTTLNKPADLIGPLEHAGFTQVHVLEEEAEFAYRDEDEWWSETWSTGCRAARERMAPDALKRYQAEVFTRLRTHKEPMAFMRFSTAAGPRAETVTPL